jgi:hypothetical protein
VSESLAAAVHLDHLVVAAASLEQGVAWCEATLGITPGPGGQHTLMGTHNRLFKIAGADYPDTYFEIIAIDPQAPPPGRARWFGLDDPALQARLAESPRLIHLVARSGMLDMHRQGLIALGRRPGNPVSAGRDTPQGRLQWQILVNDDGGLDCAGALPTLIQWQGRHPAVDLPDSGVSLRGMILRGVPERVSEMLPLRSVSFEPGGGAPLQATLATPLGEVILRS